MTNLSCGVSIKTKHSSQRILTNCFWTVDFIPQNKDWHIGDGFIS